MEVQYQLTPNDFYLLRRYWWHHKSKCKPWMAVVTILVVSILPSIPILLQQPLRISHPSTLRVTGLAILFLLFYSLLFKAVMRWSARFIPGLLDPRRLTITEDHLIQQTIVAEMKIRWNQIVSLEQGENTLYFFINNQHAFVIPRRAFPSPAEAEAFWSRSRQYWEAAKAGKVTAAVSESVWPPPPQARNPQEAESL